MDEPRTEVFEVIQAQRVEVVDDVGRVRVVVGDVVREVPDEYWPGIAVLGPDGRQRVRLNLHPDGIMLLFDQGGNNGLELGVEDSLPTTIWAGPYIRLCDGDGQRVLEWHVHPDGEVCIESPDEHDE